MSRTHGLSTLLSAALLAGTGLLPLNAAPAANLPAAPPRYTPVEKVTTTTVVDDYFGASVAVDVDTLVVGMPGKDNWGASAGLAAVFKRNLFEDTGLDTVFYEAAWLVASDAGADDRFGASVAVGGDTAVVGAFGKDDYAGAAYVFGRNEGGGESWGQVTRLAPIGLAPGDLFGTSVAMDGDTAVVGASEKSNNAGAAYVFARNRGGADAWGQVVELVAPDAAPDNSFGASVAISGDTLVVGAPYKGSNSAGAVYVFARNQGGADQWGQVAELTASDAASNDFFGVSVAISGGTLAVGAYSKAGNTGAAYVFARNQGGADQWGQVARLAPLGVAAGDMFGASVAISGDRLVVGAPVRANQAGAAYVFARNQGGADQWGQVTSLTAFDVEPGAHFGSVVAMDGDIVIAGAPDEDVQETDAGAVYIFAASGAWQEVAIPRASDTAANDYFGSSIAMGGDTAVVGAYGKASNAGAAYIFARNRSAMGPAAGAWGQVAKLVAPGAAANDFFGVAVAMDGDMAVVGATGKSNNAGTAFVFARNRGGADAWGRVATLVASDAEADDTFGTALALDGDTLAVGAPYEGSKGTDAGAVYLFARNQGGADQWGQVVKLTGSDTAANDIFGTALAMDGDVLAVGAPCEGGLAGAVYLFARNQGGADKWGQVAKLTPPDVGMDSYFGWSVAMDGDTVVVGAPKYGSTVTGTAYVFKRNTIAPDAWGLVVELLASDATRDDQFGRSVAISGDVLVVGASYADSVAGAAYVFARVWGGGGLDDWIEVKKLAASDAAAQDFFGISAAGSGSTFVVGANRKADYTGAAYVFTLGATDCFLPVIFRP